MLGRLQRWLVFGLVGSALAWAAWFVSLGRPFWALAGALLILLGHALFLGLEFVLLFFVQQAAPPASRPSVAQLLGAWWGEIGSATRVFLWRQPFRSRAEPDNLHAGAPGQFGVVFVHGFVCNRGLWNPWLRELRSRGVPFVAVDLEPVFGSIDDYVPLIERAVARIERVTAAPAVLVGHSMGGLAIRAWWAHSGADAARVRRVITIGSPHRGTWLARHSPTRNGRQMRLGSAWLMQLARRESPDRLARFTCFYGHCDNIVFPSVCATLPGAFNVHVPGTAHMQMAFRRVVVDELWHWLEPDAAAR